MDSELRKSAGDENEEEEKSASKTSGGSGSASTLVTAHGTYATQSALTATAVSKEEKM